MGEDFENVFVKHIIHQPITPNNDNVTLFDRHIESHCVFHGFVPAMCADLEREIKRMLHLLRPEDNFPSANQEKAAVTQIGDVKSRVVEEGEEAC